MSGQLSKNQIWPFLTKQELFRETLYTIYVWGTSDHFECHTLKWAHIQGKPKLIVKTPCLFTFGLGVVRTNFRQKFKIGFSMDLKMTKKQFVHLEDQISSKSDLFEKSPIMTSWRPTWKVYVNGSSVKSLGTPICSYVLHFIKIGLFLRKLETLGYANFTYDLTAAILNVVNFQF